MTAPDEDPPENLPAFRRALTVLVGAQALLGSQMPIYLIIGGLAGSVLAPSPALATLPISIQMIAMMLTAAPASLFMARYGRRAGFLIGAFGGAMGGLVAAWAIFTGDFVLLCLGHACAGVYQAHQGFFRFAATDRAPDRLKPLAVSIVLGAGLISALLGPELLIRAEARGDALPYQNAYLVIVALNIVGAIPVLFLTRTGQAVATTAVNGGRTVWELARQPKIAAAMAAAMVSYALMTLVMTSTPLAMQGCGFADAQSADVVRWHVIAMFAPSFFTGWFITRLGHEIVITVGLGLLALAGGVALQGVALTNFYGALILLGLGWNFGYIGATALLAKHHAPEERGRIQGLNDTLVGAMLVVSSFSSGALLSGFGWAWVNMAMIPFLMLAAATLLWASGAEKQRRGGAAPQA